MFNKIAISHFAICTLEPRLLGHRWSNGRAIVRISHLAGERTRSVTQHNSHFDVMSGAAELLLNHFFSASVAAVVVCWPSGR